MPQACRNPIHHKCVSSQSLLNTPLRFQNNLLAIPSSALILLSLGFASGTYSFGGGGEGCLGGPVGGCAGGALSGGASSGGALVGSALGGGGASSGGALCGSALGGCVEKLGNKFNTARCSSND